MRVENWLNGVEDVYWKKTSANPYEAKDKIDYAVDKLVQYGRPFTAMHCLHYLALSKKQIDGRMVIRVLMAALGSPESPGSISGYEIAELIKVVQDSQDIDPQEVAQVEWSYLPLLGRHHKVPPKYLGRRLADDPAFFCEVVRMVFRSRKEEGFVEEPSEHAKGMATNAYHLLSEWRHPPGLLDDGTFDGGALVSWVNQVKEECARTGHLEVAMTMIGHALVHVPADPSGLWIHCSVADVLNSKDAGDMRDGFRTELFNSRGVHWVDPTGKQEFGLADSYSAQADAVDGEGFHRLASTLRELAKSYQREAEHRSATDNFDD